MKGALAAIGLAGLVGCMSGPRVETRTLGHFGKTTYEWQTLRERHISGGHMIPSYELHAKYRLPGEEHWTELQANIEFMGTRQEYAQIAIVKDGTRVLMTDGRVGPRDDKPDEFLVNGVPRAREERDYHGGDAAEVVWLSHVAMADLPVSGMTRDDIQRMMQKKFPQTRK